jgi:hypothetical protein
MLFCVRVRRILLLALDVSVHVTKARDLELPPGPSVPPHTHFHARGRPCPPFPLPPFPLPPLYFHPMQREKDLADRREERGHDDKRRALEALTEEQERAARASDSALRRAEAGWAAERARLERSVADEAARAEAALAAVARGEAALAAERERGARAAEDARAVLDAEARVAREHQREMEVEVEAARRRVTAMQVLPTRRDGVWLHGVGQWRVGWVVRVVVRELRAVGGAWTVCQCVYVCECAGACVSVCVGCARKRLLCEFLREFVCAL